MPVCLDVEDDVELAVEFVSLFKEEEAIRQRVVKPTRWMVALFAWAKMQLIMALFSTQFPIVVFV